MVVDFAWGPTGASHQGIRSGLLTGREVREIDFGRDVEIATEVNVSACEPVLSGGEFTDAARS
jgi:hypothetical protein